MESKEAVERMKGIEMTINAVKNRHYRCEKCRLDNLTFLDNLSKETYEEFKDGCGDDWDYFSKGESFDCNKESLCPNCKEIRKINDVKGGLSE